MPRKGKKIANNVSKDDVDRIICSSIIEGNLDSLKNLIRSHGLACLDHWSGGAYAVLGDSLKSGRFDIAEFLIQEGVKVTCESDPKSTPLHYATQQRRVELVRFFLGKNAPIDARNSQNETALHIAARKGCGDIIQVLLANSAGITVQTTDGSTPLLLAAEGKHEEVFGMLLKHACANLKTSARRKNATFLNRILLSNPSIRDKVNKLVVNIVTQDKRHCQIVDELINHGFVLSREHVNEALLSAAVQKNYVALVKLILMDDSSPFDAKSNPLLLHYAVQTGHKEIVELLLKSGFDANSRNNVSKTSLSYSLYCYEDSKCARVIQLLLSHGAAIEETPELLHKAVDLGLVDVCKLLIENGANVNMQDTRGRTPLYLSCRNASEEGIRQKKDEIVKLLLDSGADVSAQCYGMTAFHYASLKGRKEAVCIFLSCGVDVDLRNGDDSTPLHCAVAYENKEIVEILCENDANAEARNKDGHTPLHLTVYSIRKVDVVQLLLKLGANIDARGFENETALHYACLSNRLDVVKYLVDNGCDINAETIEGKTALDVAVSDVKYLFNSSPSPLVVAIVQCVIKLKAAGLHVSEKNFLVRTKLKDLLLLKESDSLELATFQQKCEKEVDQMRRKKLNDETTLLDVLANSKNPNFAGNKSLMQGLETVNFEEFPIYKSIITSNLERSKLRFELKNSGQKMLDILVKKSSQLHGKKVVSLPLELLDFIISHLTNGEIKRLIRCGRALKSN